MKMNEDEDGEDEDTDEAASLLERLTPSVFEGLLACSGPCESQRMH